MTLKNSRLFNGPRIAFENSVSYPVTVENETDTAVTLDVSRKVIDALCLGLNLANAIQDSEFREKAVRCLNEALVSFNNTAYELGRFDRENELLRIDIERLRKEVNELMKERK
jgi:hypothetical protein